MNGPAPAVPLVSLDQLWFQVSGTVCNLRCKHCFISCSPDNHDFWFMERGQIREALTDSVRLGVKEYYFTGGEPFMHRDILGILADALALGPVTVLTNATVMPERTVAELWRLQERSPYSLELRVSLDGVSAESNDALRGPGAFARCLEGVRLLAAVGFLPIITTMQTWGDAETERVLSDFRRVLGEVGYTRPRLKILPPLKIGAEAVRTGAYLAEERVHAEMLEDFPTELLLCSSARLVTARGVWVCPILLASPEARLGATLDEAVERPAVLDDGACYTCYMHGAICSNMPVGLSEAH